MQLGTRTPHRIPHRIGIGVIFIEPIIYPIAVNEVLRRYIGAARARGVHPDFLGRDRGGDRKRICSLQKGNDGCGNED